MFSGFINGSEVAFLWRFSSLPYKVFLRAPMVSPAWFHGVAWMRAAAGHRAAARRELRGPEHGGAMTAAILGTFPGTPRTQQIREILRVWGAHSRLYKRRLSLCNTDDKYLDRIYAIHTQYSSHDLRI